VAGPDQDRLPEARAQSRFDVRLFVADHPRLRQVQVMLSRRPQQHSGCRFAAVATSVRKVRAMVKGRYAYAMSGQLGEHPLAELLEGSCRAVATANGRLVRRNHYLMAVGDEPAKAAKDTLGELEILPPANVVPVDVDHAIAVEEHGRSHGRFPAGSFHRGSRQGMHSGGVG
jgi:hypothetical protein